MCVLYVCTKDTPELPVLAGNQFLNNDGGGVAWIDGGRVRWRKGIETAVELYETSRNLPLPIVIHQRMRSAGPKVKGLTHPFPVNKGASVALTGTARSVLFHNGTLSTWEEDMKAARRIGFRLPPGPWSDTRWMTWAYAKFGEEVLRRYSAGQRVAVLTADGPTVVNPAAWRYSPKDTGGYWQSSDYCRFTMASLPEPEEEPVQVLITGPDGQMALPLKRRGRKS